MPARKHIKAEGVELFRIYPIDGVHIPGVRAVDHDVEEAEALRINAYMPPAFVIDPLYGAEEDKPLEDEKD
jgi:hypothetical protein